MSPAVTNRAALVIPGGRNGPYAPLLMYAADAAQARGARIERVTWSPPDDLFGWFEAVPADPDDDPLVTWVRGAVTPALAGLATGTGTGPTAASSPLLIAKSLGSCAAGVAADRGLPAVWLTPLLQREAVVRALRRATAPCLLIGGTADTRCWNGELAHSLSPYVLQVPEADHGMYVPGRLAASAAVLGLVATAIEDFLDQVVWPS